MTDALLLARLPSVRDDRLLPVRDATPGLLGTALLHGIDGGRTPPAQAPVQCTSQRRPQGLVRVVLAAADLDPPAGPATSGSGPHRCPRSSHTRTLATGVLFGRVGWQPVTEKPSEHEALTDLRIPQRVLMERA